jgi:hypothetical protein
MKTVKSVVLLAGIVMAGSLFANDAEDYGRRIKSLNDSILMPNLAFNIGVLSQLVGHIDADVLNFRSGKSINQLEEL